MKFNQPIVKSAILSRFNDFELFCFILFCFAMCPLPTQTINFIQMQKVLPRIYD